MSDMSVSGDARFLSWTVFLEPFKRIHRVRYILFFDIRNHKLLLINCDNQQTSSYDFSCVSNCKISEKTDSLLTLYLKNAKQSYTVDFYFDSNYDRNCGNELLLAIINKSILKTSTKYGVTDDVFQIGLQMQHIINRKPKKVTEWQPRILSLIQNRILLFRDKSTDYYPLCMISLNEKNFRCYKTACYDHTIQIHLSHDTIYQLHLGEVTALNSLVTKLKSALTKYNKRALSRFHPDKLPMNRIKRKIENGISPTTECTEQNRDQSEAAVYKAHEYMQSDTDDNDTDDNHTENDSAIGALDTKVIKKPDTTTTVTHTFRFNTANNSQSMTPQTQITQIHKTSTINAIEPQSKAQSETEHIAPLRFQHIPQFSNQTECKLQQPISPISDALEPYKIVKNIALQQSSPISVIDDNGNEIQSFIKNKSRTIEMCRKDLNADSRTKATHFYGQSVDINGYKRGSIDNTAAESEAKRVKKKKKKQKKKAVSPPCVHPDCECDHFTKCKQCEHCGHDKEDHELEEDEAHKLQKRKKRNKQRRNKQRRSRSQGKNKRNKSKSRSKSKRKSAAVITMDINNKRESSRKRAASYGNKALPKRPTNEGQDAAVNSSSAEEDHDEEEKREISAQPMSLGLPKLCDLSSSPIKVAETLSITKATHASHERLQFQRAESMLQAPIRAMNAHAFPTLKKANTLNPIPMMMRKDLYESEWRYTTSRPQSARIDGIQLSGIPHNIRSKSAGNVHKQSDSKPQTPRYYAPHIYKTNSRSSYYDAMTPVSATSDDTKTTPSLPPPPPPLAHLETEAEAEVLLKAPKWDSPLILSDRSQLCTFIWGKCDPKTMFPGYKYPHEPWKSDNLYQKQIYAVSAAKEGSHCFGIGANDWCFVWGKATHIGVLGLGTNIQETTPFLVRSLRKEVVLQTCCSALHSLCMTANEVIYGWGSKRLTNLSSDTNLPQPLQFLAGKGLRYLCACNTHSLAYDRRSIHIYSWGLQGPWLGYDNDNIFPLRQATFGLIKFNAYIYSNKYRILAADCSSQYTLILLNTGYVGCCGFNEHGRMAIGPHVVASSKVLWSTSTHLQNIVRISAGAFHSGFVDVSGRVYTSGVGTNYRLGHENTKTIYKAQMIESLKRVKIREIECVDSSTFVITTCGQLVLFGKEPMTNKIHKTAFMPKHLANSYRVYKVCASKEFCVLSGCKIKQPLKLPDIDRLNEDLEDDEESVSQVSPKQVSDIELDWRQDAASPPVAYSPHKPNAYPASVLFPAANYTSKRNYNHWNRNFNRDRSELNDSFHYKPKHQDVVQNKDRTRYARCLQANCYCTEFIQSSNKWNRGKCKSCNHLPQHHKKIKKYRKYYYPSKKQDKHQAKYHYK